MSLRIGSPFINIPPVGQAFGQLAISLLLNPLQVGYWFTTWKFHSIWNLLNAALSSFANLDYDLTSSTFLPFGMICFL